MRDNRNYILVKEYGVAFKSIDRDLEMITKQSGRVGIKGCGKSTRVEVYCKTRTSKVYYLACELGFKEEIRV